MQKHLSLQGSRRAVIFDAIHASFFLISCMTCVTLSSVQPHISVLLMCDATTKSTVWTPVCELSVFMCTWSLFDLSSTSVVVKIDSSCSNNVCSAVDNLLVDSWCVCPLHKVMSNCSLFFFSVWHGSFRKHTSCLEIVSYPGLHFLVSKCLCVCPFHFWMLFF